MKAKTKKEIAAVAGTVAALLIGGGLSMISGPIAACVIMTLGVTFAWIALTLTEWFEFTARLWVKAIGCVAIFVIGSGIEFGIALGGRPVVPETPIVDSEAIENQSVRMKETRPPGDLNHLMDGQPTPPQITDPESRENKYVRVKRITPPDEGFADAILIEFGVLQLSSEGFAVGVAYDGDDYEVWYGEPGRTDKQPAFTGIEIGEMPNVKNGVLQAIISQPNLTPHKSYYLCVMSRTRELRQPRDMLFFAVKQNTEMLSPKKEAVGHQYQHKE